MADKKLTTKQRKFIQAYLENGGNGTRAAKRAGYKGNDHTLHQVAIENLQKPAIALALKKERRADEKASKVTRARIIEELAKVGLADLDFFKKYNAPKEVIAKLSDKVKSLELLGKHFGVFDAGSEPEEDSGDRESFENSVSEAVKKLRK